MRIHLVLDCLDYGDGVSNDVRAQQKMYRQMGYECEIYTSIYEDRMKSYRKDIEKLSCKPDDLLIHHYCGYSRVLPAVKQQRCKKVMVYHNITPPEFVEGVVREDCEKGLQQVAGLRGVYDAIAGDSQFNLDCLVQLGMLKKGEGDVLPIPIEFPVLQRTKAPIRTGHGTQFLFVGRYAPNKKLEDIIDVFFYYWQCIDSTARLRLVGNPNVMKSYTAMLQEKVDSLPCKDSIELTGKVSDETLREYYADADVFLCMSEHEGFCIPLLEAMWHRIPVFAYDAGAVRETMGYGGVVFTDKNPAAVAHLIYTVLNDVRLVATIQDRQFQRVGDFSTEQISVILKELTGRWMGNEDSATKGEKKKHRLLKIQMQGPFETSYSLAQVNRNLIEAMHREGLADVSIHCTEGPGDYTPEDKNLRDKPLAKFLWQKEKSFGTPDVALRNMFPPVTTRLTAQMNFQSFGWEEDRVPSEYINWFNKDLDGIGTTSDFVTKALKDSGLTIPVRTMGNGVRLPENYQSIPAFPLVTKKKVRFLHISSAFPRKGVDVLLETYFATFTAKDDVCLVLKTFPNVHNTTVDQLKKLRKKYPNGPEVEHIDRDLPESELYGLYKAASCYVHCARGEGFGLPVAEAMLAEIPVIACNNSGLADFCTEATCLTVGYKAQRAHSHLSENSNWFEPDRKQLATRMRAFAKNDPSLKTTEKVKQAKTLISTKYTWEAVARRWIDFIDDVKAAKKRPTVDMVTTWNNKCGIAEFTRYFIENSNQLVDYRVFPDTGHVLLRQDEEFVQERVWHQAHENDKVPELIQALKKSPTKIVHVQYNLGFFSILALARLCRELSKTKIVIVLFHATRDIPNRLTRENRKEVIDGLNTAFRMVVHQDSDAEVLREIGLQNQKIQVIPLGQMQFPQRSKEHARAVMGIHSNHVVGSYGFLLPHKGIEKTIYAIGQLKKKYPDIIYIASCALYDIDLSREYHKRCRETISRLGLENNVLLFTDFLAPNESAILMQACDVEVMVYDQTNESASGAIRFCVAAKRPLITTHQGIFKEFESCSYQIADNEPSTIADAIDAMFDEDVSKAYMEKMEQHIESTSWHHVVNEYMKLYLEQEEPRKKMSKR